MTAPPANPSRLSIAFAFFALYVIWGSTYLAMRIGVRSLPPFMLGATRFFIAGALMWLYHMVKGRTALARGHWRNSTIVALLLLVAGNGGVVWSVQHIPSGLAALIVGTVPLWIVALEWATGVRTPSRRLLLGVLAGLVGITVLLGPDVASLWNASPQDARHASYTLGVVVVLCSSLSWAAGSLWSRRIRVPQAPLLPTSMQMLVGGLGLLVLSAATGELREVPHVTFTAICAVAYLVVFGSLMAYSAYLWLLQVVPAARVSTYAFVNPVVAVALGTAFAGEALSLRTLVAAGIIVGAVALITISQPSKPPLPR